MTTPRGATATLRYAPNHLAVTQITHTAPVGIAPVPDTTYVYDAFGRVADLSDSASEFAYTYDDNDNVLSVVTKYKAAAGSGLSCPLPQEVDYTYNTDGTIGRTQWSELPQDRAGLGAASGVRLAGFAPNAKKQASGTPVTSIRDWMSKGCFPKTQDQTVFRSKTAPDWDPLHLNANDTYDADGHLTNQTDDATSTDHSDGDACLPASETNTASDCLPFETPYPCFTNATPHPRAALTLPQYKNFTYDPLHNLTGYQADFGGGFRNSDSGGYSSTTTYVYDEAHRRDRLTQETYEAFIKDPQRPTEPKRAWGYDLRDTLDDADNIKTLTSQQLTSNGGFVPTQTTYTFNPDNQITNAGYIYDDDGNMTQGAGATLTYDAANRLTSYTYTPSGANNPVTLTFGYRPDGLRAWKQNGSARTYYFYNGTRLQYEMTQVAGGSWAMTRCNAWGAAGIYESWNVSDGGVAYIFDPQGNVVSRYTQTSGQWNETRVYDAYGQLRVADATANLSDPVGYNGQWGYYTDVATVNATANGTAQAGLVLCGHRYYCPSLARWLTRDPLGYDGGINVYAYCEDNPVGHIDPSGLKWWLVIVVEPGPMSQGSHAYVLLWNDETGYEIWASFYPKMEDGDGGSSSSGSSSNSGSSSSSSGSSSKGDRTGPGHISRSGPGYDWQKKKGVTWSKVSISDTQARKVFESIRSQGLNHKPYNFFKYNCSTWAADMIHTVFPDVGDDINTPREIQRFLGMEAGAEQGTNP